VLSYVLLKFFVLLVFLPIIAGIYEDGGRPGINKIPSWAMSAMLLLHSMDIHCSYRGSDNVRNHSATRMASVIVRQHAIEHLFFLGASSCLTLLRLVWPTVSIPTACYFPPAAGLLLYITLDINNRLMEHTEPNETSLTPSGSRFLFRLDDSIPRLDMSSRDVINWNVLLHT
jgi:hypothetical protein